MSFDGAAFPDHERFARYRALYAAGADAVALTAETSARVRAWRLDRALVFERRIAGIGHERGPIRVAGDGFDHFTVTLVLDGWMEVDPGHGFRALSPHQAILLDMRRPMRNRMWDTHAVTISMARDRLTEIAGDPSVLHGRVFESVGTTLLADFLRIMIGRFDSLSAATGASVGMALRAMVGVAIGADIEAPEQAGERLRANRLNDIRALVDAHIDDPEFGVDALIAASTLARATLYRLLGDHGGIAGYIRVRRLHRLRVAMTDPHDRRSFSEMAHAFGFKSESSCSRLFHERFGVRPGEYRKVSSFDAEPGDPRVALRAWESEIR